MDELTESQSDPGLARVLTTLRTSLAGKHAPRDFSQESVGALLEQQVDYVEEVGVEAILIARRAHADVVSAADVQRADELVRAGSRGRRLAGVEALGGILAGAGVAELFTVLSQTHPSTLGYVLASLSTVLGSMLLAFAFARR
jgi:histone H3/H4